MVRAKRRPFKSSSVLLQIPGQGHDGGEHRQRGGLAPEDAGAKAYRFCRKTQFGEGKFYLNDRAIMMHGYAQRTSYEWPGVGMSIPAWLSDYSNKLMVESGGNLVR